MLTLRLGWAAFHLLASWRVKVKSNMKIEPGCISWNWEGKEIRLGYDRVGAGPQVLLFPVRCFSRLGLSQALYGFHKAAE
jgi:hypothetical protein